MGKNTTNPELLNINIRISGLVVDLPEDWAYAGDLLAAVGWGWLSLHAHCKNFFQMVDSQSAGPIIQS